MVQATAPASVEPPVPVVPPVPEPPAPEAPPPPRPPPASEPLEDDPHADNVRSANSPARARILVGIAPLVSNGQAMSAAEKAIVPGEARQIFDSQGAPG